MGTKFVDAILLQNCTPEQHFAKAKSYEECGLYEQALSLYKYTATKFNDINSMNALGIMYGRGKGIEQNDIEAFNWFLKAAPHDGLASYNIGIAYEVGLGTKSNIQEAIKWYENATRYGITKAHVALSDIYINHDEFEKYLNKALYHISEYEEELYDFAVERIDQINEKMEEELKNKLIFGQLYLKQSTAFMEAYKYCLMCSENCTIELSDISFCDIAYFPTNLVSKEVDSEITRKYFNKSLDMLNHTDPNARKVACYTINDNGLKGRIGFLIEDVTSITNL